MLQVGTSKRLKIEVHHLAAYHETEIVLPELSESGEVIHHELEAQPSPKCQQLHMDGNLTETRLGIVTEAAVILTEVAEGVTVQVAAMGRIAERAEVRVVRGLDADAAARANQAVKFLHGADHVIDVFYHMNGAELVERSIGEGVRKLVEVHDNVGVAGRVVIDADGIGELPDAAAYV